MPPRCMRCGRFTGEARVGVGNPPTWVCLPCFEQAMKGIGERVRAMRHALEG